MRRVAAMVVLLPLLFGAEGKAVKTIPAELHVVDEQAFGKIVGKDPVLTELASGLRFVEGPVWVAVNGKKQLVFSDIPAGREYGWSPEAGLHVFREPSNNSNGHTTDLQGRLITCHHATRVVTCTEPDGTMKVIAERHDGKLLNSPNDVVVKSDGTVWFTDPSYGLGKREKEQPGHYVYRLHLDTGKIVPVAKDFDQPNGLCFSPDEKRLYICDSGKPNHIRVFDVGADGSLTAGGEFARVDSGVPDGIRCDTEGRLWSSSGEGVYVFAPSGKLLGKILTPLKPEAKQPGKRLTVTNLCFGGEDGQTLFMTADTHVFSIRVNARGADAR